MSRPCHDPRDACLAVMQTGTPAQHKMIAHVLYNPCAPYRSRAGEQQASSGRAAGEQQASKRAAGEQQESRRAREQHESSTRAAGEQEVSTRAAGEADSQVLPRDRFTRPAATAKSFLVTGAPGLPLQPSPSCLLVTGAPRHGMLQPTAYSACLLLSASRRSPWAS
jgi:hypothetical protein